MSNNKEINEAINVLVEHQKWRLGGDNEPTNPRILTMAIDTAIKILKKNEICGKPCGTSVNKYNFRVVTKEEQENERIGVYKYLI